MKIDATDAVAALSELVDAGFTHDFRIQNGKLVDVSAGLAVNPAEVTVRMKLRFETEPGSGDASNIYALEIADTGVKGFLVDALDLEGDGAPQDLVKSLKTAEPDTRSEMTEDEVFEEIETRSHEIRLTCPFLRKVGGTRANWRKKFNLGD